MAKKKDVTKIIISIIFIAYGISSAVYAIKALLDLDLVGIVGCALGLLMFITGIFGLFTNKVKVCRVLGVFVCILSVIDFALALAGGAFVVNSLVQALLAWLYFDCN